MSEIFADDPLGDFFGGIRDRAIANATALDETAEAAGRAGGAARNAGEQAAEAMETAKTAVEQVRDALSDYAARASDVGKGLGETIAGAFGSAEEAVATFVRTGKLGFSELVTSILADLAKIAVRKAVLGPVAEALSGALGDGGIFRGIAGVLGGKFHAGGRVPGGMPALIPIAALAHAPRLHGGGGFGLGPDEQAAILQRGERVLNRRETRAWEAGGGTRIVINARDAESFRASRAQVAADIARAVAAGRRSL
jgi:lambda family phage tail tape measure protein